MAIYDPKSRVAEEFINDQEIRDTLAYAEEHKSDVPLLMSILDKAAQFKGLTHREAAVLLACDVKEVNDRIFETAIKVKEHIYGSRIVLFAALPLELLRQHLHVLPVPCQEQEHRAQEAHAGGDPQRGDRAPGPRPQAPAP